MDYWLPLLTVGYVHNSIVLDPTYTEKKWAQLPTSIWQREQYVFAQFQFPAIFLKKYFSWLLMYHFTWQKNQTALYGSQKNNEQHFITGFVYDSTQSYVYSVGPENGLSFISTWDIYQKISHFSYNGNNETNNAAGFATWHHLWQQKPIHEWNTKIGAYLPSIWDNHSWLIQWQYGWILSTTDTAGYSLSAWPGMREKNLYQNVSQGIRGYPSYQKWGNRLMQWTAEYRLPIWQPDWAYRSRPIMLRDISAIFFFEAGAVDNIGQRHDWIALGTLKHKYFRALGMEIHNRITIGYHLDIFLYAGWAKGLDANGEDQFYFGLTTADIETTLGKGPRWLRADRLWK